MKPYTLLLLCALLGWSSCSRSTYQVGVATTSLEPDEQAPSLTLAGYAGPAKGRFTLTWEPCEAEEVRFSAPMPIPSELASLGVICYTESPTHAYAVSADNTLLERKKGDLSAQWLRIGYPNGVSYTIEIARLAWCENHLYALTPDGKHFRSRHNSEGTLTASALSIAQGRGQVVIVALDLCGVDYAFTKSVKAQIYSELGIPPESLLINCSHTHFAPVTQEWRTWGEPALRGDERYMEGVVRPAILRVVREALSATKPACIAFSRDTTHIGFNRSLGNEQGGYDNGVDMLRITPLDGSAEMLLFTTGCHPVKPDRRAGHFTLSANYPGVARARLREAGFSDALFLQGTAGDINPRGGFVATGEALAEDVLRGLKNGSHPLSGRVACRLDSIALPLSPISPDSLAAWRATRPMPNAAPLGGYENEIPVRDKRWAEIVERHYTEGTMPAEAWVYLQTVEVGEWRLVALSREVTTQYSRAIKEALSPRPVSVVGYTSDVSSYLATPAHMEAGRYEGEESFIWYGQPATLPEESFRRIVAHVVEKQ